MEGQKIAWTKSQCHTVYEPHNRILMEDGINSDIVQEINNTLDTKHIHQIITSNLDEIQHVSIYSKAIQKCTWLKDWMTCIKIMDLAIKSGIEMNEIIFNIFLNAMAISDFPEFCLKYLKIMVDQFKIQPSVITFAVILKSFRIQQKYKEAEALWDLMENKYNIKPNEFVFAETLSIYARSHQVESANNLFSKYLKFIADKDENVRLSPLVFGSYLNVFSRNGDIKGMKMVKKLIKKYGIEWNQLFVADLMRGYLTAKKPEKCLKTFQKFVMKEENIPSIKMMAMKGHALIQILKQMKSKRKSFDAKYQIYQIIREIPTECTNYGLKMNQNIAANELLACIYLYHDNDPREIVRFFERLLRKNLIGYRACHKEWNNDYMLINFRMFLPLQVQFILRYLFAYKIDQVLNSVTGDSDHVVIVVGTGKGNAYKQDDGSASSLSSFVQHELSSWDPPIKSSISEKNPGLLLINKQELIQYFDHKHHINFARQKLINPSKDWQLGLDQ